MSVWDTKYPKQYRKSSIRKPLRSSEKAWVDRHAKIEYKQTFLSFVRYMRWYTIDSRSYLYLKIHPRQQTKEGWTDATFGTWRPHIP